MKYIAFLRSINVGKHNRITMKELKVALEEAGLLDVSTYIQSGNILFCTKQTNPDRLIQEQIKKRFGLEVKTIVRPQAALATLLEHNTYPEQNAHITLFSDVPDPERAAKIELVDGKGDQFFIHGNNAYICANGPYHKTVFSNAFFEKALQLDATTRNIKTMRELLRLATH